MHTLQSKSFFQQYFLKLKINFCISNACNGGNQIAWKLRETANDAKLNTMGRLQKHSLAIVYHNQCLNWLP